MCTHVFQSGNIHRRNNNDVLGTTLNQEDQNTYLIYAGQIVSNPIRYYRTLTHSWYSFCSKNIDRVSTQQVFKKVCNRQIQTQKSQSASTGVSSLQTLYTMGLTLDAGIFLVCMVLILIFAVVSNFIVIFIVIRNKKMRSVTNVFIGNLAFSDIFLGAVVLPMRLHDLSHAENFHEGIAFLIDVFMH